ncbi:hypothetical protein HUK65_16300 [Rhodobacteraceae bacterium 2376]|uniref:Uncharacterized protein n=1 Tax=Rhabdonatronobacter sediminivivens TaxID=2743469 RepID=A0A7Z0I251_9RHOB|nr:hypothetical protein [Rhabdonatronobacter sediminivivens]
MSKTTFKVTDGVGTHPAALEALPGGRFDAWRHVSAPQCCRQTLLKSCFVPVGSDHRYTEGLPRSGWLTSGRYMMVAAFARIGKEKIDPILGTTTKTAWS